MATTVRPFLLSGVALAGAATVTLAAPATMSGVPTPLQLSTAKYDLTALSDVSIQGIADAFTAGWGGFIGPADPFYPSQFANNVLLDGVGGVAYYVLDQALDGTVPFDLENYFFEIGSQNPADPLTAGLGAAAYVGVGSVFGAGSAPAQLVKSLIGGGSFDLGTAIVSLTVGLPVLSELTSVYFTGKVAGGTTAYGTGLAGVFAYIGTLLPQTAGLDLTGLIAGVTGLINNIGNLIGGSAGAGHGNGHGNGNGSGAGGGSHSGEADNNSDSPDTEDSTDEGVDSSVEDHNGNGHKSGNPHGNSPSAGATVAARAAAATAPATPAKPAKSAAAVEADITDVAVEAPTTAPKRDAKRGAGTSHSAGHGSRATAAQSTD